MENASKALLIAGSVLIAIVLIAVGIKILSSTSDITNEVEGLSTTIEASIFNSQFTQHEGIKNGTEVKELIRKINLNNTRNPNRTITRGDTLTTINISTKYTVTFSDINPTDGYVDTVTISEMTS